MVERARKRFAQTPQRRAVPSHRLLVQLLDNVQLQVKGERVPEGGHDATSGERTAQEGFGGQ